jgi:dolichol-phosphate mannosyltransferase
LGRDYEVVVTMDADFSHPPERIPALVAASRECQVAVGSRYIAGGGHENWPLRRIVLSRTSNWVARTLLRLEVRDCTGAFRCFRREALEAIPLNRIRSRGYSFMEEMLWQCSGRGWRFGEVPITFVDRAEGASKISPVEMLGAVLTIVRLVFTPQGHRKK